MIIAPSLVDALSEEGDGKFIHGQTYHAMPIHAIAALEVLSIIKKENLLHNVNKQGKLLSKHLNTRLANNSIVGDIRGDGLFFAIELVKNKITKEPFPRHLNVANYVQNIALSEPFNIAVYSGNGFVEGNRGDHIMIAPPYNIKAYQTREIAKIISNVLDKCSNNLKI